MKRRKSGGAYRKERMILIASSVLVLTAMTVTGVYIYNSSQPPEPENNVVDFSVLEQEQEQQGQLAPVENNAAKNLTSGQEEKGELDYDPFYAEADRKLNAAGELAGAENQGQPEALPEALDGQAVTENNGVASVGYAEIGNGIRKEGESPSGEGAAAEDGEGDLAAEAEDGAAAGETSPEEQAADAGAEDAGEQAADAGAEDAGEQAADAGAAEGQDQVADANGDASNLHFSQDTKMEWPIVGNVLLNYSMDKTIYFPTLQQYKYNPSIVIGATQGTNVACAADGVVVSIHEDPQVGTVVVMNLGDGYELTYGQLQEIMVEEGDLVETGVFIGKVAAPTKYYTTEGTNVYFKMTKDGEPVNPMQYLG